MCHHAKKRSAVPDTSAPAAKNLPSPVITVNVVSGCSFNSRKAAMVSAIRFPPKEFSCFGRLNYTWSDNWTGSVDIYRERALIMPMPSLISTMMSSYFDCAMMERYVKFSLTLMVNYLVDRPVHEKNRGHEGNSITVNAIL